MTARNVLVQMNGLGLGGTEINAVQFAAALRTHGFESFLFGPADTLPVGPSIFDVAAEYDVQVNVFDRPATTSQAARMLSRMVDTTNADLVHAYGQRALRGAYLGPCRLARRPLVVTAYEMSIDVTNLAGPPLVVGTKYLEEELAERAGQVTLISPPVDMARDRPDAAAGAAFRNELDVQPSDVLIVWVGRLDAEMKAPAVESLIEAIDCLGRANVVLAIVGTGSERARLQTAAEQLNARLGRRAIRFTGAIADPRGAYAAADVGVGMGSSAARALAIGSPLVVVGESGWSSRFEESSAADLFRNSFWSAHAQKDGGRRLAAELSPLVDDGAERVRLGAFGRRFAEQNFGLDAMAERLAQVYENAHANYGVREWAYDLDLELHAARELVRTRLFRRPTRDGLGEYRFPPSAVRRLRKVVRRSSSIANPELARPERGSS